MFHGYECMTHPLGVLTHRAIRVGEWLIIADLHVGYASRFPLTLSFMQDVEGIARALNAARKAAGMPGRLILAGDILDDFGLKDPRTRSRLIHFIHMLKEDWDDVILLKGNHDPMLITTPFKDDLVEYVCLPHGTACILVTHGHTIPSLTEDERDRLGGIILGHEHPSIRVSDGIRSEKYAVYVSWEQLPTPLTSRRIPVLILPAFHPDVEGSDVHTGFHSPLLSFARMSDADIAIIEADRIYPLAIDSSL